jgi:hypothetical protein
MYVQENVYERIIVQKKITNSKVIAIQTDEEKDSSDVFTDYKGMSQQKERETSKERRRICRETENIG